MITFKQAIEADLPGFLNSDEFAESAVYSPVLDDPVIPAVINDVKILIDRDVQIQPSGYDAGVVEFGTTIEALYSVVAIPQKGSTFTANGMIYTVKRIQDNDKVFVKMVVTEAEQ